jgi:hypothetical protein
VPGLDDVEDITRIALLNDYFAGCDVLLGHGINYD